MWLDPLSDELRQGYAAIRTELETGEFEEARRSEPALAGFTLPTLIQFVRRPTRELGEQDAVWRAVIRCYRQQTKRLWAPLFLEMLAPALINEAYRLVRRFPEAEPAEVRQQALVSALAAAMSTPISEAKGFVKLALIRETRRRAGRCLLRSARQQGLSLEAAAELHPSSAAKEEAVWELSELRASRPLAADAALVTRVGIVGERPGEIAAALGISPKTVESRLWRARRRLRRLLAA